MNKRHTIDGFLNLQDTTNYIGALIAQNAEIPEEVYNLWLREVEYVKRGINNNYEEDI